MHELLLAHQGELQVSDLIRYAHGLGLDRKRFRDQLRRGSAANRVAEDVESADLSGVSGTPTFFVNEQRYNGAYDIDGLVAAVQAAKDRPA